MLERRGEGLPHLRREVDPRVIRKTVILAARKGELGLQEKVPAYEPAVFPQRLQGLADGLLDVVPALVGRIDAAKPGLDGQADQRSRPLLLPGRPVEKRGNLCSVPVGGQCWLLTAKGNPRTRGRDGGKWVG
jgi:hypothetical protein